jgi:hypothetical protein
VNRNLRSDDQRARPVFDFSDNTAHVLLGQKRKSPENCQKTNENSPTCGPNSYGKRKSEKTYVHGKLLGLFATSWPP